MKTKKEHTYCVSIPVYRGFEDAENEAVQTLLRGVGRAGGSLTRDGFESLVRAAFRGGVVASKTLAEERPKALLSGMEALTKPDFHKLNENMARNDRLLHVVLCAYAKHVLDSDAIGWDRLGEMLHDVLCNEYSGDEVITSWAERIQEGL